jgi:hypothetical protein
MAMTCINSTRPAAALTCGTWRARSVIAITQARDLGKHRVVELREFEPLAFCMPCLQILSREVE